MEYRWQMNFPSKLFQPNKAKRLIRLEETLKAVRDFLRKYLYHLFGNGVSVGLLIVGVHKV